MHARRHRMNRVQKRDIISDIFGGDTLPTLSFPPIIHKPTETSSSASESSTSVTSSVVTSSTESSSSSSSATTSSTSSSTSSTVSSTSSTSSQTSVATPPPSSSTIEQTAPNGSTSTLIVEATSTASPSQNPSTVGSGSNATGFLHNKVASGVVFALVGLIGLFLILTLVTVAVRAKRKAKLHQEAVSFEPTIQPEALDNYSDEKEQRRTPSPRNSHDKGYYQQTNSAFQRSGYDFGGGNYSQQYYPGGPVQLPPALYGPERARDAQPGHWNSGMASASM